MAGPARRSSATFAAPTSCAAVVRTCRGAARPHRHPRQQCRRRRGARVEGLADEDWQAEPRHQSRAATMRMCRAVSPDHAASALRAASSMPPPLPRSSPRVGGAAYAASKAGVESLTRVLASELGPWDITVNAYAPGMIPTEMNHFAERAGRSRRSACSTPCSLRRWGKPEDVANLICFLASDRAAYITGALIDVLRRQVRDADALGRPPQLSLSSAPAAHNRSAPARRWRGNRC